MRIDEVKPQDSAKLFWKNWLNSMQVKEWILNAESNYKQAGSGWFSYVWHSYGSDKVVKLAVADRCWNAYVKWLQETKQNPHTPRIYGHREFEGKNDTPFSISVIEKLKPIETTPFDVLLPDGLAYASSGAEFTSMAYLAEYKAVGLAYPDYINAAVQNRWLKSTGLLDKVKTGEWGLDDARDAIVNMVDNSRFAKTIHQIQAMGLDQNCHMDLHRGNFMLRPNTHMIVITDPIANTAG